VAGGRLPGRGGSVQHGVGPARACDGGHRAAATDPQQRRGLGDDLLELLVEQAAARAAAGDLPGALALFDARADALRDRPLRLRWHLARLELCRARGDLAAQEREQGRLYACMEGNE
jgi:hypothetical protein